MKDPLPCNPFGNECLDFSDNRSIVVLKDKGSKSGSKYRAENSNRKTLVCLRVDGCLMADMDEKKCDFLLLVCDRKDEKDERIAHFIELKGSDISTAIKQLSNSVKQLIPVLIRNKYDTAFAKLAVSKTPKVVPTKEWLDLKRLMKTFNGDASRQNSPYQDTL